LRVNGATYQLLLVQRPIDLLGSMAPRLRPLRYPEGAARPSRTLVAATAAEHGITLATRDRRAAETYRVLNIEFELIT